MVNTKRLLWLVWRSVCTRAGCALLSVSIFTGLVMMPLQGHSTSKPVFEVGKFSLAREGTGLPNGWKPMAFPKILRHTRYEVIKEGDTTVMRATSEAAASGLVHDLRLDLREYPILQWRWKVSNTVSKGGVGTKEGDDYAARIYVTFQYDPEKVDFPKKAKYNLGRILYGDIPIAAINYVWDNRAPKGKTVDSAYTNLSKMIVVESGRDLAGEWIEEERNVYEDYKKAFGEEPPLVNGVAIMTDTDNTGEKVIAYYGDIVFKGAR